MTKRFCPAGLCMLVVSAMLQLPARADDPTGASAPNSQRSTERTRIVNDALRSAVNIHTEKRQKSADIVFSAGKGTKINGMGTGIVVDERGYIVTNYHVVQDVERLRITTSSGAEYDARVVNFDSQEDLAIIKIEPRELLVVARFGTSSDLMLGEDVMAIGNAYGYESTVTRGIISHRSRDVEVNEEQSYQNLIQIDAAINPGNSGGPLINADGEVIGINVAIRAGAQRIGFAIPIDGARRTIARLMSIERHNQTYHGIAATELKRGAERKLIVQAARVDSPAAAAGLKSGDVVVRSAGVPIVDAADLERSLLGKPAGSEVPLVVLRDGDEKTLMIRLAEVSSSRRQPGHQGLPATAGGGELARSGNSARMATDKAWEILGLKLARVEDQFPIPGQPYRGGMRVVAVRANSPAESNGIQQGDVLVGLHIWETVSEENINYVLNNSQLATISPLKFYIVRGGETLFGHFRIMVAQK